MQALKRAPVHPLRLAAVTIQYAWLPSQPLADAVCPATCAVKHLFSLGAVGQFVAMPARIHLAFIKYRHAPPATGSGVKPPGVLTCPQSPYQSKFQKSKDHQIHARQRQCNTPGFAFTLLALQLIEQIDCEIEANPFALGRNPGHPNGGGQMRLARSRPAK